MTGEMSERTEKLSYTGLLKENFLYRRLFTAEVISILGTWFHTMALLGFVYATTQSGFMVSLTLITSALPGVIFGPFIGVMIDRYDRRKIMITTQVIRGVLALCFVFVQDHFWLIFVLNVLLSFATLFFAPSKAAILPQIVAKDRLAVANTLSSTVSGIMSVLGASAGGLLAAAFSPAFCFVINGVSFLVAAVLIARAGLPSVHLAAKKRKFFEVMKYGYWYVIKTPILLALVICGLSWGIIGGAYQVLLTVYGSNVFQAGQTGIGLLYATQGIGLIAGGMIIMKFIAGSNERMKVAFGWSYLLQGIFFTLFILSDQLIWGIVLLLGMRIASGVIIPLDSTLLQIYTPADILGKVQTLHGTAFSSVMQVSMFFTGIMLETMTPQRVGLVFGVLCFFVSITWILMLYTGRLNARPIHEQQDSGQLQA